MIGRALYLVFAACGALPAAACANIISIPALQGQVENAALVARVKLIRTDTLTSPDDKSTICGYIYHTHVEELFKGHVSSDVDVYAPSDLDTLPDENNYLLVVTEFTSQNSQPHKFSDEPKCKTVNLKTKYYLSSLNQALFPLWMDPDTGSPDKLYVGRKSAFTPGNFVGVNDLITTFSIVGDRIYAVVDYKKAIGIIKSYCSPTASQTKDE